MWTAEWSAIWPWNSSGLSWPAFICPIWLYFIRTSCIWTVINNTESKQFWEVFSNPPRSLASSLFLMVTPFQILVRVKLEALLLTARGDDGPGLCRENHRSRLVPLGAATWGILVRGCTSLLGADERGYMYIHTHASCVYINMRIDTHVSCMCTYRHIYLCVSCMYIHITGSDFPVTVFNSI